MSVVRLAQGLSSRLAVGRALARHLSEGVPPASAGAPQASAGALQLPLTANEMYLLNRLIEVERYYGAEVQALRQEHISLAKAHNATDAFARESVIHGKQEMGRIAWRVVTAVLTAAVGGMYLHGTFGPDKSSPTVVLFVGKENASEEEVTSIINALKVPSGFKLKFPASKKQQEDGLSKKQQQEDGLSKKQQQEDGLSKKQQQEDGLSKKQQQEDGLSKKKQQEDGLSKKQQEDGLSKKQQ